MFVKHVASWESLVPRKANKRVNRKPNQPDVSEISVAGLVSVRANVIGKQARYDKIMW